MKAGPVAWLARRRVALGFLAAVVALVAASPTQGSVVIGSVIALVGESIRVWAAGHLEKSREVTMSGPYRFMRHPLYVGSTVMGVGLAVASRSFAVGLLVATYLAVTLTAAIRNEEAFLRKRFGGAYDAYAAGAAPTVVRQFSVARAIRNREYRALAGVLTVVIVLALKALW
ncbi:MAG: isoprenylcysteine carboxylmethyltransferase family protein [Vicinamibacterales bacterium]